MCRTSTTPHGTPTSGSSTTAPSGTSWTHRDRTGSQSAPALAERDIRINALCPGGIDTTIIPLAQRSPEAVFMTPEQIAAEVIRLMDVAETGKTWAKVAENKPAFIVRAPGDKSG